MPLGRYLTEKLMSLLGITESQKIAELFAYQEEIFSKHFGAGVYFDNIVGEDSEKRQSVYAREKIFKKRGSI